MNKRAKGEDYEKTAAAFLSDNSVKILERNFRCRTGEVDIIGIDGSQLVFFEVKYRKNTRFGLAYEAVNTSKQMKICSVSDFYRMCHVKLSKLQVRYDVIAFQDDELTWIKNAFEYINTTRRY